MKRETRISVVVVSLVILIQLAMMFCTGWLAVSLFEFMMNGVWQPMGCLLSAMGVFPLVLSVFAFSSLWNVVDEESDKKP